MRKIALFTILLLFVFCSSGFTQETWTLEDCIRYAQQYNIQVLQSSIGVDQAEIGQKQSKQARYPNLNGVGNYSANFGRSIDPTSNSFIAQSLQANSFSLSAGAPIYNGFQLKNSLKRSEYDLLASEADKETVMNNIALSVAQAYLQILLNEDQVEIAKNRLVTTKRQLERTDILINAGQLPRVNRLTIEAQTFSDEQAIIFAENLVQTAYITLKSLLNKESDFEMTIVRPEILVPENTDLATMTVENLYTEAINTQPQIMANEYKKMSAKTGVDVAKGALQPSLSAFGSLGTNYSSRARKLERVDQTVETISVDIGGMPVDIGFPSQDPVFGNYAYFNQLADNFSQAVGLRLSVPIYNNGVSKLNVQRAELNVISQEYTADQARQQLKADIQRALADARGTEKELAAAKKSVEAQTLAFDSTEKRYNLGAATTFEYAGAKDNLDIAKANLVSAEYRFLFQLKVLDFYVGKQIKL